MFTGISTLMSEATSLDATGWLVVTLRSKKVRLGVHKATVFVGVDELTE